MPSTQPATAVANSAKKKIRPRSVGPGAGEGVDGAAVGRGGRGREERRRVGPSADVGVVEERAPEAALAGQRLQRGARVGDRDEGRALRAQGPEVLEQRQRLDRAAGL